MKCREIIAIMEKLAPKDLAESWDNVGLQIGNMEDDINRILLTLDVTDKVVDVKIAYAVVCAMWSAVHQIVLSQKTAVLLKRQFYLNVA